MASAMGFMAEPAWRPLSLARLNLASDPGPKKSRPPTMAKTWPSASPRTPRVTAAASGLTPLSGRMASTAASAAACNSRSMVVRISSPPSNSSLALASRVGPKSGLPRNHCLTSSTK